jgi:hypothetical protein
VAITRDVSIGFAFVVETSDVIYYAFFLFSYFGSFPVVSILGKDYD